MRIRWCVIVDLDEQLDGVDLTRLRRRARNGVGPPDISVGEPSKHSLPRLKVERDTAEIDGDDSVAGCCLDEAANGENVGTHGRPSKAKETRQKTKHF